MDENNIQELSFMKDLMVLHETLSAKVFDRSNYSRSELNHIGLSYLPSWCKDEIKDKYASMLYRYLAIMDEVTEKTYGGVGIQTVKKSDISQRIKLKDLCNNKWISTIYFKNEESNSWRISLKKIRADYYQKLILFWLITLAVIDKNLYKSHVQDIAGLAYLFGFTEAMIRDWSLAVRSALDGCEINTDESIKFETDEAEDFFRSNITKQDNRRVIKEKVIGEKPYIPIYKFFK